MGTTSVGTTTTTSRVDTDLSVTITPKSASNKILVMAWANRIIFSNLAGQTYLQIRRGSTLLSASATNYFNANNFQEVPASMGILDSPNTTSPIVYGTILGSSNPSNTAYVQGLQNIIVMEVAA